MKRFPFYKQLDAMDCGPACLRMIAKYHGKHYSLAYLREKCYLNREGVSLKGIASAAETIGFRALAVKIPLDQGKDQPSLAYAPMPIIAHWNQNHFVVVQKISKKHVWLADPAEKKHKILRSQFIKSWVSDQDRGIALLLEPGAHFLEEGEDAGTDVSFRLLANYLKPYRKLIGQIFLGMILGAVFSLIFPFLTQALVDQGIQQHDLGFIYLVLLGQLMVFAGRTAVNFIQSWILLHIGVRLNVSLINDFLMKLMRLPLSFFDAKMTGDLLQRIGDHQRIESFLTQSALSVLFSLISLSVFGVVLAIYSSQILFIFLIASVAYIAWITFFLKRRRAIDYQSFSQLSSNQDSLIEIIHGIQEIKLQGSQFKRRWRWAGIQAKLFRVRIKGLALAQYQDIGGSSINQLKNIFITFFAAQLVIKGEMTLGMMLAIQYIIGQLNGPLQQMIGFVREAQDAAISMERLNEIHEQENEENEVVQRLPAVPQGGIRIENLSFRYNPLAPWVLDKINLMIPEGKITAVVGVSGSGKTTLLKLLLGFYQPEHGQVKIGGQPLITIRQNAWRANCGVVMQDGYIFNDTIANNISESDDYPDYAKLQHAVEVANIDEYINDLPLGFSTMIGASGNGLSQGQRQRVLIARAVYKNPNLILLDEATNALDANNEKVIMEKLNKFFEGRTVIIVAHRLSTVKHADQIVVLDGGAVIEMGDHKSLVAQRGAYFTLVKNQLELGH
ncbi:MAG: peptidase domain-containing ABC transporter [Saprospiraceae bacterium]|nr:peptidase domain-containing ABC transporter [Lewinella sp.]